MSLILGTDGTTRIREKLGVSDAILPDSVISQADFLGIGEINIKKIVPNYATLLEDDKTYLEAATVCEIASLLCSTMKARIPKKEAGPQMTFEHGTDWSSMKTDLEFERDVMIGKIEKVISTDNEPFYGFRLTDSTWEG